MQAAMMDILESMTLQDLVDKTRKADLSDHYQI
jgi:DNA-binding IscR family transcriptional regulator